MHTALNHILAQPSPVYPIIFCFSGRKGIMNMMGLSEGKMIPIAYASCLVNAVLAKEGMEYSFYIYIATVI